MLRVTSLLAVCGLTCLALGPLTGARAFDDKRGDRTEGPRRVSEETKAAQLLVAASRMAQFGREHNSPEALLAAARVIATVPFRSMDPKNIKAASKGDSDVVKEAQREAYALVNAAERMAQDPEAFKKLADPVRAKISEMKARGGASGPQVRYGTISRVDNIDRFIFRFRGGEPAVILVSNLDRRGDIDLIVRDDSGNVVASDRRSNDDATVTFYPPETQTYLIQVLCSKGPANRVIRYRLTTN